MRPYVKFLGICSLCLCIASAAHALDGAKVTVGVNAISKLGVGNAIGTITFEDTAEGLKITTNLSDLPPGQHGFHIHENPSCEPKEKDGVLTAGQAAGPHFDPLQSGHHAGPHGGGHAGDLPFITARDDGKAESVLGPVKGLTVESIRKRSVMIHAGGDNYSDTPAPLGGGGARIACGVIG